MLTRHLRAGTLKGARFGRAGGWRIRESDLQAWLARHARGGSTMTTFHVGDLVWFKGDAPSADTEGAIMSRQGKIEDLTDDAALVRWKAIDASRARWLPEVERVRLTNLVHTRNDKEPQA